jgi:uncharacterized FAD-dependent dehydrogenase
VRFNSRATGLLVAGESGARRDPARRHDARCHGLFPCGERAGDAGGIVSAAMDGEHVVERLAALYPA